MMQQPIRIELPLDIMFQTVNCYLIPGDPLTLIDCGMALDENWQLFEQQISVHGYQVQDIEQIVITHEHVDHIGLLPKLLAHTNARVYAPQLIKRWFTEPEIVGPKYIAFAKRIYTQLGFPSALLQKSLQFIEHLRQYPSIDGADGFSYYVEGDHIPIGNTNWEVLHTPGHCPTQHVLIQTEEKSIFSSDMLLPLTPMPIVTEDLNQAGEPVHALKDLLHSFERLKAFDFQMVYPGHGPIFQKANLVIDHQIARIHTRKQDCLKILDAGAKTIYDIHQQMYPRHQMPPNFSGIHMIMGYLDLLEDEGQEVEASIYQKIY